MCVSVHDSFSLRVCVCKICAYKWQCVREKMPSVLERLREIMCSCACLNQSVDGACLKLCVCLMCVCRPKVYKCSECRSMCDKNICTKKILCLDLCVSPKVMASEFACKSVGERV